MEYDFLEIFEKPDISCFSKLNISKLFFIIIQKNKKISSIWSIFLDKNAKIYQKRVIFRKLSEIFDKIFTKNFSETQYP